MNIRFLKRWRGCREGDVREWPDGAANILISRDIAIEATAKVQPKSRRGGLEKAKTK